MTARSWLCAVVLLASAGAWGATPDTVFLDELTSPEVRDQLQNGKTTVIVPVGGTEQNGAHMVLGKHNARVRMLSEKIARSLGNALVAPVVAYVPEGNVNPPGAHMRFAGTITVPDAAFRSVVEYAARSFRQHGFRDIVYLADHGDYRKSLAAVAERLNREWAGSPARVHSIDAYYVASSTGFAQILKRRGYSDREIGTHGGVADTSLALAVDPRLVRSDRLGDPASAAPSSGVNGDPRRASAELGQLGVDAIVGATVDAIRHATARH